MKQPSRETVLSGGSVFDLSTLLEICQTPWGLENFSPLQDHPCLLLQVSEGASLHHESLPRLVTTLRGLPCPVIAVGEHVPEYLMPAVDVRVASMRAAQPLLHNIRRNPLAASTLVQLLRHNEEVPAARGLLAESLAYATLQSGPEFAALVAAGRFPARSPALDAEQGDPLFVTRHGSELHIAFNRPQNNNAYNAAMREQLYDALQLLQVDSELTRCLITGEGPCFSVGGDLAEFGMVGDAATAHAIRSMRNVPSLMLSLSARIECRVHRACIGSGIELPAFASRLYAREDTVFQLPELSFGLLPGAGGTVSLLRRIGRHRLAWWVLSGRRIRAATALEWGLVDDMF